MATWQQIEAILDQVLDLNEPERTRYIEEHIDDDELKAEIRSLLRAELHAPAWIDTGVDRLLGTGGHIHEIADSVKEQHIEIDRYRIEKEIGRGGMSVVYLAYRTDGEFDQKVAVKIIQPFGLDREDRFRRLRAERQILANLQHPNIARVFDGGVTPEGWPYMVMELVNGIPITTYCNKKNLNLNTRLMLFQNVCDAVIYAHRNLVVHRDLKPGNILITDSGEIKLLDFGIAKMLEADNNTAPLTQTGRPLMTPEYAAPEQFKGENITTSVDVYSLGVILYELLAGVRPYDLSDKNIAEMERLVCEEEPSKPSERIRKPDRFPLPHQLQGDLDIICLKALRKEPDHRYKSVQELKEDLIRYQQGLPVQARPASIGYRTHKFIKRNKTSLVTVALFLIAITAFAIYHIYQITAQRNIAQAEAEKATRIKEFTTGLFYSSNPYAAGNVDEGITLKQILDTGLQNIENELADDPEVYAEMQYVMGHAFMGLGDYKTAQAALEEAVETTVERFGENQASVASYLLLLGRLEGMKGNFETALTHLNRAMEINRQLEGERSSKAAVNLAEIARVYALSRDFENALEYYTRSLAIHEELGEEKGLAYNQTLSGMVNVQTRMGMIEEAEKNQLIAIENYKQIHGKNHLNLANSYQRLAEIEHQKSNFSKSEKYALQSLDLQLALLPTDNPHLINIYNFLGLLYQRMGRHEDSEKNLEQAIRLFAENNRTDSLNYSSYLNNLALTKTSLGQLDSAAVIHQQVLDVRQKLLPPDNPSITLSMYNLAYLYHRQGNLNEAKTLFEQVVERDKHSLEEDHPEIAIDLVKLAAVYRDLSEFSNAENAFLEAEAIFTERFPEAHHRTGEFYREYGRLKMMLGQNDQAFEYLNKSMAIFKENYDDDHDDVKSVEKYLAALSQTNEPD